MIESLDYNIDKINDKVLVFDKEKEPIFEVMGEFGERIFKSIKAWEKGGQFISSFKERYYQEIKKNGGSGNLNCWGYFYWLLKRNLHEEYPEWYKDFAKKLPVYVDDDRFHEANVYKDNISDCLINKHKLIALEIHKLDYGIPNLVHSAIVINSNDEQIVLEKQGAGRFFDIRLVELERIIQNTKKMDNEYKFRYYPLIPELQKNYQQKDFIKSLK